MLAALFLSLIILQYLLTGYFLKTGKFNNFIIIYIYSLFSYDYIFINASYYLPSLLVTILKPYSEYLLLYFVYYFFIVLKRRITFSHKIDKYIVLLLVCPTIVVLLTNDFTASRNIGDTVRGLRLYLLPVIVPYFMYRCDVFKHYRPLKVVNMIFVLSIIAGIYGHYQKRFFNGNVQTLWFYKFFSKYETNPVDYGWSNFIRNDSLRITGYFVSPIIYSLTLCVPVIIILTIFANSFHRLNNNMRFLLGAFLAFFLCYQWFTITRIGLIIDGIAIMIIVYMKLRKYTFFKVVLIPIGLVIITFASLLLKTTSEASALGRIDQYQLFFDYYSFFGLGFNNHFVLTYFDTYFMSLALLYGTFTIFPLLLIYKLTKEAYNVCKQNKNNYFAESVFVLSLTFLYCLCFQFVAGSCPYRLYFLLLFMILAYDKSHQTAFDEAHNYRFIPY